MSVAIRAITRLQDADDVNVSLGAGVDEYALCWDNDTAKFVLRAVAGGGVTDHGALTGLTPDDDHTQYTLLAGRAGGQTIYGGTAANEDLALEPTSHSTKTTADLILANAGGRIVLADTTTALTGVIYKGADRFIHNFHHPSGQSVPPDGGNMFIGVNAGNFTMGSTATSSFLSSANVGIGQQSLSSNTTGYSNTAVGYQACISNTTGYYNFGLGAQALYNTNIGYQNTAIGGQALFANTSGHTNIGIGTSAGRYISGGSVANQTSNTSIYLGALTKALADAGSNEIVLGYNTTGFGSNSAAYGNASITKHVFQTGSVGIGTAFPATLLHAVSTTATNNAIRNVLTLGSNVTDSGVGAAGLGAAILFQAESTTTVDTTQARIAALWYEATHATFKADLVGYVSDAAGEREIWRGRGNGSAAAIGFLGAAPVARIAHVADPTGGATVDAEARSAINSILATLETFGFHATS